MATLQLVCGVCHKFVEQSDANDHLRSHSKRNYTEFDLEMSPRNIRDLIRVQIEMAFEDLKWELPPEVQTKILPKLMISDEPNPLFLSYKITTERYGDENIFIPFNNSAILRDLIFSKVAYRARQQKTTNALYRDVVLKGFCNDCQDTIVEDAIFTHLRKKHGLGRAGKKKQQYLREQNAESVRANFDGMRFIIHPLFIREIFVRYFFKSVSTITAILSAKKVEKKKFPRFLDCMPNEVDTHLVRVQLDEPSGVTFVHIPLEQFPSALLHVWRLNKVGDYDLHPDQYDYLNVSIGKIGITRCHSTINQAQCLEYSKNASENFGEYSKSVRDIPNIINNEHGENYEFLRLIGFGNFGKCFEVILKAKRFACKVVSKSNFEDEDFERLIKNEISIHSQLKYKHVIELIEQIEDGKHIYMIQTLCTNGSLRDLQNHRKVVSAYECRYIISQILHGIRYIHEEEIIHRDLKPRNILIDHCMQMKICDFGLSIRKNDPRRKNKSICGTMNYIPPEVINNEGFVRRSDIWAIGVITFELLFGHKPFEEDNTYATYRRIALADYNIPSNINYELKDFLESVFDRSFRSRPTASKCLELAFFKTHHIPQQLPMETVYEQIVQEED